MSAKCESGVVFIENPERESAYWSRDVLVDASNDIYMRSRSRAFLIDTSRGLFVTSCEDRHFYNDPRPDTLLTLKSQNGHVMRARMVGQRQGLAFLQVVPEDRASLKNMPVFAFDSKGVVSGQKVQIFQNSGSTLWGTVCVDEKSAGETPHSGMYTVSTSQCVPEGLPILSEDGLVVGFIYRSKEPNSFVFSGLRAALQYEYFLKKGKVFSGHLGCEFYTSPVECIEKLLEISFNPQGCDKQRGRVVVVGKSLLDPKSVPALPPSSLRPLDVVLSLDGKPVYTDIDIMRGLMEAESAGQTDILVSVWRFGKVLSQRIELRNYETQLPTESYVCGPCTFVEVGKAYDAKKRYVRVSYAPKASPGTAFRAEYLLKINGVPIKDLSDVKRVLDNTKGEGFFLHLYPSKYSFGDSAGLADYNLRGGVHTLVHIPAPAR